MKKCNTQSKSCQQNWHSGLQNSNYKIFRIVYAYDVEDDSRAFTTAQPSIKKSLKNMLFLHELEVPASDLRIWYNYFGFVKEVSGYLAIKSDKSDMDLRKIISQSFQPLSDNSVFRKIKVIKCGPKGRPDAPKRSFPFQHRKTAHAPRLNQQPHVITITDGKIDKPIKVLFDWKKKR